jgi:hypothetical protein
MHQLKVFFYDIQTETDSIEIPGMRFSDLLEGAEDSSHIARLDANPRIRHAKFNMANLPDISDPQLNATSGSKFKRIADKIL